MLDSKHHDIAGISCYTWNYPILAQLKWIHSKQMLFIFYFLFFCVDNFIVEGGGIWTLDVAIGNIKMC